MTVTLGDFFYDANREVLNFLFGFEDASSASAPTSLSDSTDASISGSVSGSGSDPAKMDPERVSSFFMVLAGVAALLTIAVYLMHLRQYRRHWTQPKTQTLILVIMSIVPVWAVISALITFFPVARYGLLVPLDIYESLTILVFLKLIYWYLGGKDQVRVKAEHKTSYRTCLYLYRVTPGEKFMKVVHIFIYQFVIIRPLLSILVCALYYSGFYEKGRLSLTNWPTLVVTLCLYTSLGFAMWALLQLYRVFSVVLQPYSTGSKFLALKFYIFMHALWGFFFTRFMDRVSEDFQNLVNAAQLQYSTFTVLMFISAILNITVFFHYKEYVDNFAGPPGSGGSGLGGPAGSEAQPILEASHSDYGSRQRNNAGYADLADTFPTQYTRLSSHSAVIYEADVITEGVTQNQALITSASYSSLANMGATDDDEFHSDDAPDGPSGSAVSGARLIVGGQYYVDDRGNSIHSSATEDYCPFGSPV